MSCKDDHQTLLFFQEAHIKGSAASDYKHKPIKFSGFLLGFVYCSLQTLHHTKPHNFCATNQMYTSMATINKELKHQLALTFYLLGYFPCTLQLGSALYKLLMP